MSTKFSVEVQQDFLDRLTKARPLQAVAELIWNALDADATDVRVSLLQGEIGLEKITVRDNGTGIPRAKAPVLFGRLGGSWKTVGGRSEGGRFLHGYEGRGRFKAFALGRVADWEVVYSDNGESRSYTISLIADRIREGAISEETDVSTGPGVVVEMSELHRDFRSLREDSALQELAEVFALYLMDYSDVSIRYEGVQIDPASAVASQQTVDLQPIEWEENVYPATLDIIEWRNASRRVLYLCSEAGFPLSHVETRFHVGDLQFAAYLKSPLVTMMHGEAVLELAELTPSVRDAIEEARGHIKAFARERAAQKARAVVEEWKTEKIYPYLEEILGPIDEAERKVFDIVAVTASEHLPDFDTIPRKNKAFHLRMLRSAIEKSPSDLQLILNEVLDLPKRKQEELADLLREASLSAIIGAAKVVADRLNFLTALELILFDRNMKARLKERSQLHRILADNTWIFGEEFHLSVDDRSLTEVLRAHKKMLGEEIVIDEPVKHITQKRGIVDLMLSRAIRQHRPTGIEHLVVELKRPSVRLGSEEVTQIEKYAISVARDARFRDIGVVWNFVVLSDDYDEYAGHRRIDDAGTVSSKDNITVRIKTWSQVLEENRARLQFFQEKLELQVDQGRALSKLQKKYSEFLEGVVTVATSDEDGVQK